MKRKPDPVAMATENLAARPSFDGFDIHTFAASYGLPVAKAQEIFSAEKRKRMREGRL